MKLIIFKFLGIIYFERSDCIGGLTIGIVKRTINKKEILNKLKEHKGFKNLSIETEINGNKNIHYVNFLYSDELEDCVTTEDKMNIDDFEERSLVIIEVNKPFEYSDNEAVSLFNIPLIELDNGYTYFSLGEWGSSIIIISMIIKSLNEGYILMNSNEGKIIHIRNSYIFT